MRPGYTSRILKHNSPAHQYPETLKLFHFTLLQPASTLATTATGATVVTVAATDVAVTGVAATVGVATGEVATVMGTPSCMPLCLVSI